MPKKSSGKKTPATLRVIKPNEFRIVPWKNGRGETKEIAVDSATPFRWRLSRARLAESGPFSLFPGYDRKLMPLNGTRVRLEPESRSLAPGDVHAFPGELPVSATVLSPGEDLNLLTLRTEARATLHLAKFDGKIEMQFPFQGHEHFVCVLSGEIEFLDPSSGTGGILHTDEVLWITRPADVNLLNLRACGTGAKAEAAWAIVTLERE